jgi:hypothetical protein
VRTFFGCMEKTDFFRLTRKQGWNGHSNNSGKRPWSQKHLQSLMQKYKKKKLLLGILEASWIFCVECCKGLLIPVHPCKGKVLLATLLNFYEC